MTKSTQGDTADDRKGLLSSRVETAGRQLARYGLVVVVGWIGLMKFTAYEAEGISTYVANSPLMSWVYGFMSHRGFSAVLGVVELTIAILIAVRPFWPRASIVGSVLAVGMFLTTPELPRHDAGRLGANSPAASPPSRVSRGSSSSRTWPCWVFRFGRSATPGGRVSGRNDDVAIVRSAKRFRTNCRLFPRN